MRPREGLIQRIEELGSSVFEGEALRHVSFGYDPLSGTGARIQGGRWNPRRSFPTLYLALDYETVVAEFYRSAQRQGLDARDFLPRELHTIHLRLDRVLDLRDPASRSVLHLTDEQLRADDLRPCQAIGESAHYLGLEALLAPSAAGSGTACALFLDRLQPRSLIEVVSSDVWEEPPPRPGEAKKN